MNETITQKSFNKKLLIFAGVLLVAASALAALSMYKDNLKDVDQTKEQEFSVSKTDLVSTIIPSGFPENLPEEDGSKVLQNYEAKTTDGRVQSTRVITTEETSEDIIKIYTDFFTKLGWVIVPSNNDDSATLMVKGNDTLLISTSEDASNVRSVSLALTAMQ